MNDDNLDLLGDGNGGDEDGGPRRKYGRRRATKEQMLEDPGNTARVRARRLERDRYEYTLDWERQSAALEKQAGRSRMPTRLAENLRVLLASKRLSVEEAVKVIPGLAEDGRNCHRWLKRVSKVGLVQLDKRTRARLEHIAAFFDYTLDELRYKDIGQILKVERANSAGAQRYHRQGRMLWELLYYARHGFLSELVETLAADEGGKQTADEAEREEEAGEEDRLNSCLESFYRLLESGDYDFLQDLVFALYRKACTTR